MIPSIRWTAFKLAVFTVVTIIVTTWLAAVIGNARLFSSPYLIKAEFSDVTGLLVGDVVKAAGVTVGRVDEIAIDDGLAVVSIKVDEGVELPEDLSAQIRFRNLIGQRMVTLDSDGGSDGLTESGDLIPLARTDPAFDLTALFNGLRPLIYSTRPQDINTVTRSVTTALKGRSADAERFLANLSVLADTVSAKDEQLDDLLTDVNVVASDLAGRDAQLRRTLGNLRVFLSELAEDKDDLDAALVTLDQAATILGRVVRRNDENIASSVDDLAILLDAVDDKRADLRGAVRALPEMLLAVERVSSYGEWTMTHILNSCKDDSGTCGARWMP